MLKFVLFADDTCLFYSYKNNPNAEKILNAELKKVSNWLAANKLSLNVGKSNLLLYSSSKNTDCIKVSINNENVEETNVAKYLGVLIDNKLNWESHINSINLKLSKGIGLLAKIRHF